jgi:hypothetical protein
MENNEITSLLERIAIALERIADVFTEKTDKAAYEEHNDKDIKEVETCEDDDVLKNTTEEDEFDVIEEFLNGCGIKIKTVPPEDAADDVINSLSEFLGKNYDGLRELLAKIKRNMQQGGFITISLRDYSQKDVSNVCQFSTRLHEIAFLEQYKYFKSPQYLIKAKTTTLPTAQNFFSGKWLERFVLLSAQRAVNLVSKELDKYLEFSYLLNPQVILPNGDDFELDLIFHVNGSYYWIEAKSGDYQQHISKYSKMSRILNLDFEHSIMVLTDISPDKSAVLTSLFSMTVSSLSQLEEMLIETIKADQIA